MNKIEYPKRSRTLMGLMAVRPALAKVARAFGDEKQPLIELMPIKYMVTLVHNKTNTIMTGQVVTHLELEDWCWMKDYSLSVMEGNPELALHSERTNLA
jgi:hypothetical protein